MAKKEFIINENKASKKHNPIKETEISTPETTFNLDDFTQQKAEVIPKPEPRPIGRPKKGKVYGTIRLQRYNLHRVNALQNTLEFETQDDMIADTLDNLEKTLTSNQKIMYDMYMKTYLGRDAKIRK